jgi:hypothetical protein
MICEISRPALLEALANAPADKLANLLDFAHYATIS